MFTLLFFPLIIILSVVYFFAFLFSNTFGVIPRLILAIILVLIVAFVIKNFFAIVGILFLIGLAFYIRFKFILPKRQSYQDTTSHTFDGEFEEIDDNKK
ncbi:AFWIR motif membrane protein [Leuconostoc palmae]|uniref:AFWIR motif membrane protein n=1 Tax=Leuconostoc palmae TaxID=501487 RepID=UPI001C7CB58A|nr:ribonuclease HIII [Leuconostoc palmae]